MTERMLQNRVKKLKELERQQKELEGQIEAFKGRDQGRHGGEGCGAADGRGFPNPMDNSPYEPF